jgi:preprotein translocase subunit SecD
MRPVEVMAPPGAPAAPSMLESVDPKGVRYQVGAPVLTEQDVRDAVAHDQPGQGWVIDLELTAAGARKLNQVGKQLFPKIPPQNSIAIVVDGKVQSAPAFQEPRFEGRQVQVYVPGMTAAEAKAMAASLRP